MDGTIFWLVVVPFAVFALFEIRRLNEAVSECKRSIAELRAVVVDLNERLASLSDAFDGKFLSHRELENRHFDRLPALLSDSFVQMDMGEKLGLLLRAYTDQGSSFFCAVEYAHERLDYRSPGEKDAVAYGRGRLKGEGDWRDVKIFFARPLRTATLTGLSLDGHVKEGRLLPQK